MKLPSEELRHRLETFVAKWRDWSGSEEAGAQPFLLELLACYGVEWKERGVRFEVKVPWGGFVDLLWPGVCLVEMKRPSEEKNLTAHYKKQAIAYWVQSGSEEAPPPAYVVMCSFTRFEVWRPGFSQPRISFDLDELPKRQEALAFLAGDEPDFTETRDELTREAVKLVTDVYRRLVERKEATPDALRDMILQCVWCMFAEDLGLLPGRMFSKLLDGLVRDASRSSADDLGRLFEVLGEPGPRPPHGAYARAPYVDGQLFETPARVHLLPDEVTDLRAAAIFDWTRVEPAIFGSILEGALGRERQWSFGAHYTSQEDILKVVDPTIVAPWSERIDACATLDDVRAAQDDLAAYRVLDPACGSGNFLYVAYRELRKLEVRLAELERSLRVAAGQPPTGRTGLFKLTSLYGIEREPFAVRLARVTLSIGHTLAVRELGLHDEPVLPLDPLPGIVLGDALKTPWPEADAIVGNPPYHGSQQIRSELGDEYAAFLQERFGIGLKDYAVYWFRLAHERLAPGGRAGFVATNSISQNRNRGPTLDWIAQNGGVIVDAVSKIEWPGLAVVNVSIVNWIKDSPSPPVSFRLDGASVLGISPSLRPIGDDVASATRLRQNEGRAFQGPIPADNGGFILRPTEATALLARDEADYVHVIRPYLTSEDIAEDPQQQARRHVIDFGFLPLEQAASYPAALAIVRARVKPFRDQNRDSGFREHWWRFGRPRRAMREAIGELPRYIAGTRHGVRLHFCWCDPTTMASDATNVFAFATDYEFGVLSSSSHAGWARAQSSTIRQDIRYTPTTAFETFPWPQPTASRRDAVGAAARAMIEGRQSICAERQIGLTRLYNEVDDGAYAELRDLHSELDEAVAAAYGWPTSVAHDAAETNRRLFELNHRIADGELEYRPFD